MIDIMNKLNVFISYAHADSDAAKYLCSHLKGLGNDVNIFIDLEINPGVRWGDEIKQYIYSADFIILLVSRQFLGSKFISNTELPYIMERYKLGKARIIPIKISDCLYDKNKTLKTFQYIDIDEKDFDSLSDKQKFELISKVSEEILLSESIIYSTSSFEKKALYYISQDVVDNSSEVSVFKEHVLYVIDSDIELASYGIVKTVNNTLFELFLAKGLKCESELLSFKVDFLKSNIPFVDNVIISFLEQVVDLDLLLRSRIDQILMTSVDIKNIAINTLILIKWKGCIVKSNDFFFKERSEMLKNLDNRSDSARKLIKTALKKKYVRNDFDHVKRIDVYNAENLRGILKDTVSILRSISNDSAASACTINPESKKAILLRYTIETKFFYMYKKAINQIINNNERSVDISSLSYNIYNVENVSPVSDITTKINGASVHVYAGDNVLLEFFELTEGYAELISRHIEKELYIFPDDDINSVVNRLIKMSFFVNDVSNYPEHFLKNIDLISRLAASNKSKDNASLVLNLDQLENQN